MADTTMVADKDAGKVLAIQGGGGAAPCSACHGVAGQGMGDIPSLAGASEYYLQKQLQDFRAGSRKQALMQPMAAGLTDKQIIDVAAYYSSLPTPVYAEPLKVDADILAAGEQLAERGDIARQLVACANCHGPRGVGLPPAIPRLMGQTRGYIASQLNAWQKKDRINDDGGLMAEVASQLTQADIDAVAAYYSTVRP
ncbi:MULTISPECIES: c-type cytochrome [Shewanella]|nr:c-type cytochrome [Shewanella marisflavi]